jgi:hypothetical protein
MKTDIGGFATSVLIASMLSLTACGERQPQTPATQTAQTLAINTQAGDVPTITYTSEPDPPRAGDNAVSVLVRDKDGTPMMDLAVTTTYFMPAMPTMNMPEMRDSFMLVHRGEGEYAGNVRLSMGGTWVVTIAANRGDAPVARKVVNIVAKE